MNKNNPYSELQRLVLEALHGLPYEEARFKECPNDWYIDTQLFEKKGTPKPIDLSRILAALHEKHHLEFCFNGIEIVKVENFGLKIGGDLSVGRGVNWKMLRHDKTTATHLDQDEEDIKKLITIFKG